MNIRHHALALWGFGLRLDPDYAKITRFFPAYITDSVFEYRSYAVVLVFAALLAMPHAAADLSAAHWLLVALWGIQAYRRGFYYTSELRWWRQAWKESPHKTRTMLKYSEILMDSVNARYMAGEPWESPELQADIDVCVKIQDEFVSHGANVGDPNFFVIKKSRRNLLTKVRSYFR